MPWIHFCFHVFSLVHNPYDEQVYLCVAMTKNVLLMQWYEPLDKFMKVKVIRLIL
jgi:mitogen-activated protein kinase kinase kinase kinase 3/[mitogen-activated protein kinase] kinase 5